MHYANADHWDAVFRRLREQGEDLDWQERWVSAHLPHLQAVNARRVLDLGCGSGNDVLRLARAGFQVTGLDFSPEAVRQGREKARAQGLSAQFLEGDMARELPFPAAAFDAVMSNVALHMFDAATTRAVFVEVARIVRPGGAFVFHVNSTGDAELRARRRPPVRALEEHYVLEQDGQTMRFFDRAFLEELLSGWNGVTLREVEIVEPDSGAPFKRVWHGAAIKPTNI